MAESTKLPHLLISPLTLTERKLDDTVNTIHPNLFVSDVYISCSTYKAEMMHSELPYDAHLDTVFTK